jgi:hypothetical protein
VRHPDQPNVNENISAPGSRSSIIPRRGLAITFILNDIGDLTLYLWLSGVRTCSMRKPTPMR